jgi:hypothetical protein
MAEVIETEVVCLLGQVCPSHRFPDHVPPNTATLAILEVGDSVVSSSKGALKLGEDAVLNLHVENSEVLDHLIR